MSVFYVPITSSFGQNIRFNAGSKLFFFVTGTTTPKTTFADVAETIPNTDPVVADSTGRFGPIFITGAYDVELKDANDVQIWKVIGLINAASVSGMTFKGGFDSSTNAGDYPATGDAGDFYVVTTGFILNPTSGSHILDTGDSIVANKNGATGIDADWDVIRGVEGARLAEVSVQPWSPIRAYSIGNYVEATDFKQYRARVAQTDNDPAGGGDPTNWFPFGDLINDAVTDDSTRGSTAAVAKNLQDQINAPTIATASVRGVNFVQSVGDISNNTGDPINDIDFAARTIVFSDKTGSASIAALTKRLDTTFATGNNAGGLASALSKLPLTTYHCFALSNPTGSVRDYGFDTSPIATNLLADAVAITAFGAAFKWERLWAIRTDDTAAPNSVILGFNKKGRYCYLDTLIGDLDITNPGTGATLRALSTPGGVPTIPITHFTLAKSTASDVFGLIYNPDIPEPSTPAFNFHNIIAFLSNEAVGGFDGPVLTNNSSQISTKLSNSNVNVALRALTSGWIDITLRNDN